MTAVVDTSQPETSGASPAGGAGPTVGPPGRTIAGRTGSDLTWSVLIWSAGLLAALAVAGVVMGAWLNPRFDYLVDDGFNHALRLALFKDQLKRGVLYPRWWPDLVMGYGYPLLHYYSPGIYYLGAAFGLLGASTYRALQLVAITSALLGAAGAYVLGAIVLRRPLGAFVLAVAYVGAPYPFVTNLYNRSAFPEAMGLGVLPWLLTAGWLAARQRSIVAQLGLGLALAGLILVHSLSALVGAGVLVLWVGAALLDQAAGPLRRAGALAALRGAGLGLALAAFFWVPAIFEQGAVHAELGRGENLSESPWLFDPRRPGPVDVVINVSEPYRVSQGSPFDLHWVYPHARSNVPGPVRAGLAQALFLLLSLLAGLAGWLQSRRPAFGRAQPPDREDGAAETAGVSAGGAPVAGFPAALLGLCVALTVLFWLSNTTWSRPLWRLLPSLSVLQFPWRLYGPLALTLAFCGAAIYTWLARRRQPAWLLALLLAAFVVVNGRAGHPWEGRLGESDTLPPAARLLRDAEGAPLASGTTSDGEFLPRSVILPQRRPDDWSWRGAFEGAYPSGGWIAGRLWPLAGTVDVSQVWETPSWTAARVTVAPGLPAEVAFRTLVFPGWQAFVDGRPVSLRSAGFDAAHGIGQGFAIVAVPEGEHVVALASGPTLWELVGASLTICAVGAGALALLVRLPLAGARRTGLLGRPAGVGRPGGRLALGMGTGSAAVLVVLVVLVAGAGLLVSLWPRLAVMPGGSSLGSPLRSPLGVLSAFRPPVAAGDRGSEPFGAAPARTAIVLDLLSAAVAGRDVRIGAPDGDRLGQFVSVGEMTLGGQRRPWLYMHPPSEVQVQLDVPPRAVFQAGLGLDPRSWNEPDADGVRFVLEVVDAAGRRATLLDQVVQPQVRPEDRGWRFALVDLGAYAGQRVTLSLRTEGRDTPLFDWAGWGTPLVYVDRSGRYPPPAAVAPAPR